MLTITLNNVIYIFNCTLKFNLEALVMIAKINIQKPYHRKNQDNSTISGIDNCKTDIELLQLSYFFKRLFHITQVFSHYFCKNILPINRGTHSYMAHKLGIKIADGLGITPILVAFILLIHDAGHFPFGHAIERKVNTLLMNISKAFYIEHNIQIEHVIKNIEKINFCNICTYLIEYLSKSGFNKRIKPILGPNRDNIQQLNLPLIFEEDFTPIILQIEKISDVSTYLCHDVIDCIRQGYIKIDDLYRFNFINDIIRISNDQYKSIDFHYGFQLSFFEYISDQIITFSKNNFDQIKTNDINLVSTKDRIINFPKKLETEIDSFKSLMTTKIYRNPNVAGEIDRLIEDIIEIIFNNLLIKKNLRNDIKAKKSLLTFPKQEDCLEVKDILWSLTDIEVLILAIQLMPKLRKRIQKYLPQYCIH